MRPHKILCLWIPAFAGMTEDILLLAEEVFCQFDFEFFAGMIHHYGQ